MHQDNKFWAKNDEMLLADTTESEGPRDTFKSSFGKLIEKKEICAKINSISHANITTQAEIEGPGIKKAHNYKWTTVENQFTRKKKRLFEELPTAQPTRADLQPLFSSFNPGGVFAPGNT